MAVVPQIDFFMGRTVIGVGEVSPEHGDEATEWYIEFEGNGRIYITDESYEMPDPEVLEGKKLSKQVLSAGDHRLFFGTDENPTSTVVYLPPVGYEVSDPTYKGGERVNPNQPPELDEARMEASAPGERVVDGPEQPQEAVSDDETDQGGSGTEEMPGDAGGPR